MLGSIQLKTFHSLTTFSFKSPSSSSTFTKLNKVVYTLISTHLHHLGRAFSKTKSLISKIINNIELIRFIDFIKGKSEKNKNKHIFGSFRFHYNWGGSSHVLPGPPHVFNECHVYYDSVWNSIVFVECDDVAEAELSGYLHWLEEQVNEDSTSDDQNEIDKLAETFIASCHEKFKLEKEESYRRYQEMLARSL